MAKVLLTQRSLSLPGGFQGMSKHKEATRHAVAKEAPDDPSPIQKRQPRPSRLQAAESGSPSVAARVNTSRTNAAIDPTRTIETKIPGAIFSHLRQSQRLLRRSLPIKMAIKRATTEKRKYQNLFAAENWSTGLNQGNKSRKNRNDRNEQKKIVFSFIVFFEGKVFKHCKCITCWLRRAKQIE